MPELPEVESARAVIERAALGRRIVDVDDSDTFVCRPHAPGRDPRRAGRPHADRGAPARQEHVVRHLRVDGPVLGIHLGMSGKIVIAGADGTEFDGGDYWERGRAPGDHRFTRFSLTFADGGALLLVDPRRLGRVRLDPPVDELGPDAAEITPAQFRAAFASGTAPVKARLLDQDAIAGIGNLLADQALWLAKINPRRPVRDLTRNDVDRLYRAVPPPSRPPSAPAACTPSRSSRTASPAASAPATASRWSPATVGGRTTWWCPREQT